MAGRLAGKSAFVTAAGAGIGRAAAFAYAQEGAQVVATDINEAALKSLAATAGITTRKLDVTDAAAVERAIGEAGAAAGGAVDVLLNCAGFVHHGTILDCAPKDWEFSVNVNLRSMYFTIRAALPGMLARGKGSIVNIASVASSLKGFANRFVYGTTKAGVIGLTKAIAADYVKHGIRCNAVCPGTVDTPSLQGRIAAFADPAQARKDFVARQPMGRLGSVDDITPILVYLASDESVFATGQAFIVDGGIMI
jgi:2-keto-3-deoxy-L-fuconate dehydrogenase